MFTISNAPASIILTVTVLFLVVLSLQIDPTTKSAQWAQNVLWFTAINVAAVAAIYAAWAFTPIDVAYHVRDWAKLVDGLAAFGVAGAMIGLHRTLRQ